ncbi:acyl-CoA thioesterase [Actinomycetota bacterium]
MRQQQPAFEHRHLVTYAETNAVGNVYFATYFTWQGLVREMFLSRYAPDVLAAIGKGQTLVTVDAHFDFYNELFAFDQVLLRMHAGDQHLNRLRLHFEVFRENSPTLELIARGHQTVAWMNTSATGGPLTPAKVPDQLRSGIDEATVDFVRRQEIAS